MSNYESDFYTWTHEQAHFLRSKQFAQLDMAHLIEEIETMGRSEKRELESRLTVLLLHLLKWHYQPERRSRSWLLTIEEQRIKFASVLTDNPGLKQQLPAIIQNAYRLAKIGAAKETLLEKNEFPDSCPWRYEEMTDDNFYPD
jgi:hypothetical protein